MPPIRKKSINNDDDEPMLSSREEGSDYESSSGDEAAAPSRKPAQVQMMDKDSDEEELERFVLGDTANFREHLFEDEARTDGEGAGRGAVKGEDGADDSDLEDVADVDLFAFDVAGTGDGKQLVASSVKEVASTQEVAPKDAPAWEDSDDERLAISLANTTQLRKLRISEAEDVVSGTEYINRLRQQYLRLNPLPDWAREPEERPSKRRRRSSAGSESGSDASGEMDLDGSEASALPLDKFLRDASALRGDKSSKARKLRPEVIDIQRTRDIPDTHKDAVTSIAFHPEYPVLLSSSTSSILHLHHISPTAHPTPNPLLTSAQVKQVNVQRAEFLHPTGDKIFFAGRRRYIHSWDLPTGTIQKTGRVQGHRLEQKTWERFRLSPCGRYLGLVASTRKGGGIVNILNAATMQWIAAARLDSRGGIIDFSWWSNGNGLTILGKGGQVGEFSMASRRFLGIWHDEGSNGATAIAMGGRHGPATIGGDRWVAIGSGSGVTNIYDRQSLLLPSSAEGGDGDDDDAPESIRPRPTPTRSFMQMTTPVTFAAFSPDGQVLAFGSRHKKDALRLAHLPSCTVYRNWPTEQTPLGRITAVAFAPRSDMLAVANDSGKIRLWEIRA